MTARDSAVPSAASKGAGLDIAFFGSSLVSAYWNGAATYYRGIIRALAERGIVPARLAGTSIGALIASAYVNGMSIDEMQSRAESLAKRDLFRIDHMGMLVQRVRTSAIYLEEPLRLICESIAPQGTFAGLRLPLLVNTVDVERCPELLDPGRSMLGLAQERWLDRSFSESAARWNLIGQQTLAGFPKTLILGLDATSHTAGTLGTATFANFKLSNTAFNPSGGSTSPGLMLGDPLGLGKITIADATTVLQYAVKLGSPTAAQTTASDVNKDGKIDIKDVTLILKAIVNGTGF